MFTNLVKDQPIESGAESDNKERVREIANREEKEFGNDEEVDVNPAGSA